MCSLISQWDGFGPCRRSRQGRRNCPFRLDCVEQTVEVVEIGRVAAHPSRYGPISLTASSSASGIPARG